MSQPNQDVASASPSPSARAAGAADVMAVALRLGVGLPAGVERQSAEALDAVARNLREGEGSDSVDAVDAILSIVPPPARGVMRLAAAGGDVRTLLGFLERVVAVDRRRRWDRTVALSYPIGVSLCAVVGIVLIAIVQDPLITRLAEPMQVAMPVPDVPQAPVWDAVDFPAAVVAAIVAAVVVLWYSRGQFLAQASRRWAAVACELEALCDQVGVAGNRREMILDDLRPVVAGSRASQAFPPLVHFLRTQGSAERPGGLSALADFYRETSDAVSERRVRMLPVVGAGVAGLAVLLYGIALFVPLTRLFDMIASMPVAPPWSPGS